MDGRVWLDSEQPDAGCGYETEKRRSSQRLSKTRRDNTGGEMIHPFTKLIGSDAERGLGLNAGKDYDETTMCVNGRIELYNWTQNRIYLESKLNNTHPVNVYNK